MIHRNKSNQRQQCYHDWQTHSAHKMREDLYVYKTLMLLKRLYPDSIITEGVGYLMTSYAMQDFIERLIQRDLPYLKQYYPCDHYAICIAVSPDKQAIITYQHKQTGEVFYQDAVLWPRALPPVSFVLEAKKWPQLSSLQRTMFMLGQEDSLDQLYVLSLESEM